MSTFQNATPEPKQLFLNLLMKNADFLGQLIATGKYTESAQQMLRIITDIYFMAPKEKVESLYQKLETWIFESGGYNSREIQQAHLMLKEILQSYFFSELRLGIIPTSTLQSEKNAPLSKPITEMSSRI